MIKLLIADDEPIVIESIQFVIDKFIADAVVVGTASSGREAIEKALYLKPDVILMDIRMPGINGIEAIKQIKETHQDICFVIITAHEYFEYAKDAVNLGVQEYLVKPLNKNKLIDTLKQLSQLINGRREAIQREIALKERINILIPHMEGQFIYSQLFNGRVIKDLAFYEEIFNMNIKYGYVFMTLVEELESEIKEEHLKNSIQRHKFYEVFSEELKCMVPCLIGPPLLDRLVAYIPADMNADIYEIRNNAIEMATRLTERINRRISFSYKIGVGKCYPIESFTKSCDEAYMAASFGEKETVTHFEDIQLNRRPVPAYPLNNERLMIQRILVGDIVGALEIFEEIFRWLSINYMEDIDNIKTKLIEMVIVVKRTIPYEVEENDITDDSYLTYLFKAKDINELRISFINYFKSMVSGFQSYRERELSGLISEALDYINHNYDKDISLDGVAKEINMSYHYFSKFFKDAVGKNFIDYLTDLRVDKSKELLKDPTLSIKSICYSVGYSDPNYFSKIFKKTTGITPTEYRVNLSQEVI